MLVVLIMTTVMVMILCRRSSGSDFGSVIFNCCTRWSQYGVVVKAVTM